MDLSSDLDALFQLPLNEFTGARNALASRLQKEGRTDEADQVRKLTKPPVSAWVVNQLFWKERTWFDRLLASGAKLRQAQAAGLAGKPVNVHDPLKAQREALNELSRQAAVFLSQNGHAPSPDVLRRVTLDLQGLAAQDTSANGPAPGRLTADVEATGFDALAALVPKSGDGPSRGAGGSSKVLSFAPSRQPATAKATGDQARRERERAQAAAARRAVQDAERTLAAVRREATRAEAAMKAAAARLKELEREKQKAEAALEKATAGADTARQAARRTASEAADAAQAVDDAERMLARAKDQLRE